VNGEWHRCHEFQPGFCLDALGHDSLRLSLIYHYAEQIIDVEIDPLADRVDKYRVRGGHAP